MTSSSYAYTTIGNMNCGPILKMDKEDNSHVHTGTVAWVNGYLTGRNYELNRDMMGKTLDSDSIYYSIIKFCKDNPLKKLNDAALSIDSKLND